MTGFTAEEAERIYAAENARMRRVAPRRPVTLSSKLAGRKNGWTFFTVPDQAGDPMSVLGLLPDTHIACPKCADGPDVAPLVAAPEDSLDPATALRKLGEALTAARVKAGKPKLVRLAQETGYSESMLSRVFNGHVVPQRDKLVALAEYLDVAQADFTEAWLPLWEAANRKQPKTGAAAAAEPPPAPAAAPEVTDCFKCPVCKGQIQYIDAADHIEWHASISPERLRVAPVTQLRSA